MRQNNLMRLAILAYVLCASHAMAQSVPAIATVGDLASIQSETLIGKATLAKAQVYADLSKFKDDGALGASTGRADSGLPQVTRIVEANGVKEATLVYANGKIDAREHDRIPGGYVVVTIHPEIATVQVRAHNGHLFDLPVSSLTGLSATPGTATQPASNLIVLPPNPTMVGAPQPQQPTPANAPRLAPSFAGPGAPSTH